MKSIFKTFLNANLKSGINIVLEETKLEEKLKEFKENKDESHSRTARDAEETVRRADGKSRGDPGRQHLRGRSSGGGDRLQTDAQFRIRIRQRDAGYDL